MDRSKMIKKTEQFVSKRAIDKISGHDLSHSLRVLRLARKIADKEKIKPDERLLIELAILLHDVVDWKFNNQNQNQIQKDINKHLKSLDLDITAIKRIKQIIDSVSFKGSAVKISDNSLVAKIVRDADRLDTLGAIGIARVIATGAVRGRVIYNPKIALNKKINDYRKRDSYSSIHHFYDKILLLKDLMNTKAAKQIAAKRHTFVEKFLDEFLAEWQGKK